MNTTLCERVRACGAAGTPLQLYGLQPAAVSTYPSCKAQLGACVSTGPTNLENSIGSNNGRQHPEITVIRDITGTSADMLAAFVFKRSAPGLQKDSQRFVESWRAREL